MEYILYFLKVDGFVERSVGLSVVLWSIHKRQIDYKAIGFNVKKSGVR